MNDVDPQHPVSEKYTQQALLAECFNSFFELAPDEVLEFDRLMAQQSAEVTEMVNSFEASGQRKGKLTILRLQLEKKFGPLSPSASDRLAFAVTRANGGDRARASGRRDPQRPRPDRRVTA